ncbi:low affinity immunoglobulin gamma Fc region receptor II-like [Clarias gariepinus]|uniref:low affinity immunoglobulin gamma Fc region receptor II-like n=1 Tax=Clarias gariepinus TaxID=13013 RepID=UPI00234DD4EB|nr:low affinity immunoglobulin gamma Fc region receptor II-like [Clarias gariepinus]
MDLSPLPVMFLLILLLPAPHAEERPCPVLSVSPQSWVTEGDSVTLICEVTDSSTDWTFSWYRESPYRESNVNATYKDSRRGSQASYTISPAALKHTGVYTCRGERDRQMVQTDHSLPQPLWITGESPPVSLIINPNRTQHFTGDSLSLSCEDQSNSTGWSVRRYTHNTRVTDCSQLGPVTGSTCKISSLNTSYTGVYWCESESGENSNPVNITVYDGNVILESPVHPVTEGHPLTLRCLYRNTKPSNPRADFYKDGSVLQKQTTGEMIIHNVSKSDEGFYHCNYSGEKESEKSWVSVKGSGPSNPTVIGVGLGVAFLLIILLILILLQCHRIKKEKQQKTNQASEQNQSRPGEAAAESGEVTYAQGTKKTKANRTNDVDAEPSGSDVTYAELEMKQKKTSIGKTETASVGADTVYSEVKLNTE